MMAEKGEGWRIGSRQTLPPTPLKTRIFHVYIEFSDKISFEENNPRKPKKCLKTSGVETKQEQGNSPRKQVSSPT